MGVVLCSRMVVAPARRERRADADKAGLSAGSPAGLTHDGVMLSAVDFMDVVKETTTAHAQPPQFSLSGLLGAKFDALATKMDTNAEKNAEKMDKYNEALRLELKQAQESNLRSSLFIALGLVILITPKESPLGIAVTSLVQQALALVSK